MVKWKLVTKRMTAASMAAVMLFGSSLQTQAVTGNETTVEKGEVEHRLNRATSSNADRVPDKITQPESSHVKASDSDAQEETGEIFWDLTGTDAILQKADGTVVEKLEGGSGFLINAEGKKLKIDASKGKFAVQKGDRTQVNPGTKITVPVNGETCLLRIEAHKAWNNNDQASEEENKAAALAAAGISGVSSCTVETIETASDSNYRIYTYRCVMEENSELTMQTATSGSAYMRSISVEKVESAKVRVEGTVTLPEETQESIRGLKVILKNTATQEEYSALVDFSEDLQVGTYHLDLKVAGEETFEVSLNLEEYVIVSDNTILQLNDTMQEEILDLQIEKSLLSLVTGKITGLENEAESASYSIEFKLPQGESKQAVLDGNTYSVWLERGKEYTPVLQGSADYEIKSPKTVLITGQDTIDLEVGKKEVYPVDLQLPEDLEIELAGKQIVYVYTDAQGNRKEFTDKTAIQLCEGIHTLSLEGDFEQFPYEIKTGAQVYVKGEQTVQKVTMKQITSWGLYKSAPSPAFEGKIEGEIGYFRGLKVNAEQGKLAARDNDCQFSGGAVIQIPVTGPCKVTVEAHSGPYALYTINGVAADTTSEVTTVEYTGDAGYVDVQSTGTAYIKSISLVYPPKDVEIHEQEKMPKIAEYGTPDNLNVQADGQTLRFTQTGGTMSGKEAIDPSVSYYLFPSTTEWDSLQADVVIEAGTTSSSSGVFMGAFDGTYMTTIALRGKTGIRGVLSKKSTEYVGASGPNKTIEEGTKVTFKVQKTENGFLVSATDGKDLNEEYTYKYNSSSVLQFKENGADTECQYGFGFANVTAAITNMILTDKDGKVLYDQNACYDPAGVAPIAESISAQADPSREFIHVTWTGTECEGDGHYVLQVSRDGETYVDVADNLTGFSYDYPVTEAGDYYFRVCGTLGNRPSEADRNQYVEMKQPVHIVAALQAPKLQIESAEDSLTLRWDAIEEAVRYEVYRYSYDETDADVKKIAEVTETSYKDKSVEMDMPYYYYVIAYSKDNYSNPSDVVWAVATQERSGEYVYEDEAVEVTITKKSYDTSYQETIILEGVAEESCTLKAEVNGQVQAEKITLGQREPFHLDLTLKEGRNDVNLLFTDENGNVTRKTFNYVYLTHYDKVVDASWDGADGELKDGIPVYRTVQAAVDSVDAGNQNRVVILVKEGSYREHLEIDKPMISLIGEDREMVNLHFYEEGSEGGDMYNRAAIRVTGEAVGFSAENLTFENDYVYTGAGGNESADALRNDAEGAVYVNVAMRGYQDSLCTNKGTQYYYKCLITGNVDFIYGNEPRALFKDCDLVFRYNDTKNSGYVAAPKTSEDAKYGMTFEDCRILAEEGCSGSKYLLARPWGADAYLTFINCYMGNILNAEMPYSDMSGNAFMKARFFEYGSYGPGFLINESRRQISASKAESMLREDTLGWNPYKKAANIGTDNYVGNIVTKEDAKYVLTEYSEDTYTGKEGDDTHLGRFAMEGYAQAGKVTGGGLLKETSSSYYSVATAEEFLQALTEIKKSGSKAVIELTADIGLGSKEIKDFDTYNSVIKAYGAQPLTHPELKRTGTSILMLKNMSNLTIFSRNGARILHANVDISGSENIIIRNLAFDELWEWDEETEGAYDRNDWDYMTIENESTDIWIDHCTFYKSYDGVVDVKNPSTTKTSNITISWCQFLPGSKDGFFDEMMQEMEQNPEQYPYYTHLIEDMGMTKEQVYMYAYGQKKTHLLGQSDDAVNAANIRLTLANNYYKESMDRMPRMRYGDAHVYNCVMDAEEMYHTRNSITNPEAAKKIVSNGASSTCGGQVLLENCYINDIVNALNSGNGSSPSGYINAVNSVYYMDGEKTELEPKANSTADDRVLILDAETFKKELPYEEPVYYSAERLDEVVIPNSGAGVLDMTVLQWEKGTYHDAEWTGESDFTDEDNKPGEGEKPDEGDKPGEGEKPDEGDKPGEGEKPDEGDKPTEGDTPNGSGQDDTDRDDDVSVNPKPSQNTQKYQEMLQAEKTLYDAAWKQSSDKGQWALGTDGVWRLIQMDGTLAKNKWVQADQDWYHFDLQGNMQIGWFQDVDGKWYYLHIFSGKMQTGWQMINEKWYYLDESTGTCLIDAITPDGKHVDETGARID